MRVTLFALALLAACKVEFEPTDTAAPAPAPADDDGDGFDVESDCDDTRADIYPGAPEDDCADPTDYNCDGSVGYADGDGDGYAACEECDDGSAAINPAAAEVCNGLDDDCDGATDDADPGVDPSTGSTWYTDGDGDGFGDPAQSQLACEAPEGTTADSTDCDDGAAAVNPSAAELCDGVDNNCDGATDEPTATDAGAWYQDADGDGYGDADYGVVECTQPEGYVADATDCDDADGSVSPAGAEVCDGVDNNCDGAIDEPTALDALTWYQDTDGDGYGDPDYSTLDCAQPSGYSADSLDCDDGAAAVNPAATEVCDGVDNDCDGLTDDPGAADAATWYSDGDGDGYGDASAAQLGCTAPSGTVSDATDCDDADSTAWPGATEICDGDDEDCDGEVDDPADLLGSGAACAARNCNEILSTRTSAPDGEYFVDHAGTVLGVYCDMTTSGGGWTVIHPDDIGSLGSLDTMRDDMDRVMAYLRDTSGNRYTTELEQLPAFTAYDVAAEDQTTSTFRFTFIPRAVAAVAGQTQGMRSNGSDLTFTNCDANPNSYIEFWKTGTSYTWNQDYTMSIYWRDSKIAAAVSVPDDYFTFTAVHFGGCGTHSTSPYWVHYDGMQDAAFAVR